MFWSQQSLQYGDAESESSWGGRPCLTSGLCVKQVTLFGSCLSMTDEKSHTRENVHQNAKNTDWLVLEVIAKSQWRVPLKGQLHRNFGLCKKPSFR